MNRKTAGIALVVVAIVAFPAILFAEDISLGTVDLHPKNWSRYYVRIGP